MRAFIEETSLGGWLEVEHLLAILVEPTHRLDVLGHYCPVPVSMARRSLEGMRIGEVLEVVADDPETMHDMPILVERLGHRLVDVLKHSGEFRFIIEVIV